MSDQTPQDPYAVPPAAPVPPPPPPGYGPPPPAAPGYGPPPPGYGPPPPGYGAPPPAAPPGYAAAPAPGYAPPPPGYGTAPVYPQGYSGGPPPSNGLAIGALIVGIIGLLACWIPYVGLPLPIIALILGFLGLKKSGVINVGRGMSVAGIVIGGVSLLIALFITVVVTIFIGRHAHILDCGSSNLTPAQQQQCIRDELNIPSFAPS
jgi:hypothetical protein